MKTTVQIFCSVMVFFAMVLVSCSKDGDIGPIGPAGTMGEQGITGPAGPAGEDGEALGLPGPQGEQGLSGADGQDGADGDDGVNGVDGVNGEDGNANVQTFTFDTSLLSGDHFELPFAELTQDVIDNDVLLFYIKNGGHNTYNPIPGISFTSNIEIELVPNLLEIYIYDRYTGESKSVIPGEYTLVKAVIIKSSSTTTVNKTSSRQRVLDKLKNASVNIEDYYQVMDFYGLEY